VLSSAASATHQGADCERKAFEYSAFDLAPPRREALFVFVLGFRFCGYHFGEVGIHNFKLDLCACRKQRKTEARERERDFLFFFWVNESNLSGKKC
jgi:hypothetical protein